MKIQIRKNVFETNSSSTHALNVFIGDRSNYDIPKSIIVRCGEFGWDFEKYHYPEDKLAYIYTWINYICYGDETELEEYKVRLTELLKEAGVEEIEFEDQGSWDYIDHPEDLFNEDLETLLDKYFIDYVFNTASYVETGNDNSYTDVSEDLSSDWSFYKGN